MRPECELPPRGHNLHNYLTAGTDEVSMGMVKRVVERATGGSCRDPEAVSWSRNKTGAIVLRAQYEGS